MQNRSTRRPSPLRSVRPGASWALASGSIRPRIPVRAAIALDSGDPPLRADSLRSPALRCVSPLSPEPTGCDKAPKTLEGREVATAPYHPHGTGKSSCRAPARIVDAAHVTFATSSQPRTARPSHRAASDSTKTASASSSPSPRRTPCPFREPPLRGADGSHHQDRQCKGRDPEPDSVELCRAQDAPGPVVRAILPQGPHALGARSAPLMKRVGGWVSPPGDSFSGGGASEGGGPGGNQGGGGAARLCHHRPQPTRVGEG